MKMSQAFPSKYVSSEDLGDREMNLIIASVEMENVGQGDQQEMKPVVYFRGAKKGLILNKTNSNTIVHMYGDDTVGWIGKEVTLGTSWVEYQGKQIKGLRIRPGLAGGNGVDPQAPQAVTFEQMGAAVTGPDPFGGQEEAGYGAEPDLDSEIPF